MKCSGADKSERINKRNAPLASRILLLRAAGHNWTRISRVVGVKSDFAHSRSSSAAIALATTWCRRNDVAFSLFSPVKWERPNAPLAIPPEVMQKLGAAAEQ